MQERRKSSVLAMELRLFCINPSIQPLNNFVWHWSKYKKCLVNAVDTDGLVFYRQEPSNHNADYAPICFQLFINYFT